MPHVPINVSQKTIRLERIRKKAIVNFKVFYRENIMTISCIKYGPLKNNFNKHPQYLDPHPPPNLSLFHLTDIAVLPLAHIVTFWLHTEIFKTP